LIRVTGELTMEYTKLGKFNHIDDAVKAVELKLSDEEISCLEELYVPHPLAGVMAQNKPANAKGKHVWTTGDQEIKGDK